MAENFYITTTLPYVNAQPHIGFALEIVAADVIARHKRQLGNEVIFNTGTDEHGQKIHQQAMESGLDPQTFTDVYAAKFSDLKEQLDLSYTHFIRTTNPNHKKAAQHFWKLCADNGDIYKDTYQTLYCVGCELEKQASELEDGKCPLHPNLELEQRNEENYFFRFSKFQNPLLDIYQSNPDFVKPESKLKEISAFVEQGLQDFSISRLKEKMPWGVDVPGDPDHVMYVWFDALVNYISTLGWPNEMEVFDKFWPGVQLAGKDNLRQQSAMWQAMLLSAGLRPTKQILLNGFISVDGQKMSKSLGNVISPEEMVERYSTDGTRFLLMMIGPFGEDMDVSWDQFDTVYNAYLSNGVGNVCSRIAKMCSQAGVSQSQSPDLAWKPSEQPAGLVELDIKSHMEYVNVFVQNIDQLLSELQPWMKQGDERKEILEKAVASVLILAELLGPIMPSTAQTIAQHFSQPKIEPLSPLFPRI